MATRTSKNFYKNHLNIAMDLKHNVLGVVVAMSLKAFKIGISVGNPKSPSTCSTITPHCSVTGMLKPELLVTETCLCLHSDISP